MKKLLTRLNVGKQLTILIGCMLFFIVCVGGIGLFFLSQADQEMNTMYTDNMQAIEWVGDWNEQITLGRANLLALLLTKSDTDNAQLISQINYQSQLAGQDMSKLLRLHLPSYEHKLLINIKNERQDYLQARRTMLDLGRQNKNTQAYNSYRLQTVPAFTKYSNDLAQLSNDLLASAKKRITQNQQQARTVKFVVLLFVILSGALGGIIGWLTLSAIKDNLAAFSQWLKRLGRGDFTQNTQDVLLQRTDEFGEFSHSVIQMTQFMQNFVKVLQQSSEQLASVSEELSASAEQTAQTSTQVAASVAKVAESTSKQCELTSMAETSVVEIVTALGKTSEKNKYVANMSEKNSKDVDTGIVSVNQMVTQIDVIKEQATQTAQVMQMLTDNSKQIGQIVETMSELSSQTHLLSLNAAIESAHAGEAGKGFAVVAEEIRKLAARSQESAKRISDLIVHVQEQIQQAETRVQVCERESQKGGHIVLQAEESFKRIRDSVKESTAAITQILTMIQSINDQSEQVNQSIQSVSHAGEKVAEESETISASAQEQSATIEEIASTSTSLTEMAVNLQKLADQVKV